MAKPLVNSGSFKKGQKKIEGSGRKAGKQNLKTRDLKEALLGAAEDIGFIQKVDIVDQDGKPTGETELKWNGDGGLQGYLTWLGVYHPHLFAPQLGLVMPTQINVKSEAPKRLPYPSLEDTRADLRAMGIDPDVIERAMMPKFLTDKRPPVIDGEVEKTGVDDAS